MSEDRTVFKQWKQLATEKGLICSNRVHERDAVPAHSCGISLTWLERFAASINETLAKDGQPQADNRSHVVAKIVLPATLEGGHRCRFWNLVPPEFTGPPQWYVTATRTGSLCGEVAQISECLAPLEHEQRQQQGASGSWKDKTFLWLGMFSLCQHPPTVGDPPGTDLTLLKEVIQGCKNGVVAVLDPCLDLLNRTLCLYTSWVAVYYGGPHRLKVALPVDMDIPAMIKFLKLCASVDVRNTVTPVPEDKVHIMSEIKHSVGMQRMNRQVSDVLLRATHNSLRWSGRPKDLAALCCILLEHGEYCQLQAVLCTIPDLLDDTQSIQDMRDLFKMYDTDGSGELDFDEFIHVLRGCMGDSAHLEEDAAFVFSEAKGEGVEGGISLQEFEAWWTASQREQRNKPGRARPTTDALRENLSAMAAYLERAGLHHQAEVFRRHEALAKSGAILAPGQPLPAPNLRGEWAELAEQVAYKTNTGDSKVAAKMLYELLILNSDMLDIPPHMLSEPTKDSGAPNELLAQYMDVFSRLLKHQGPSYKRLVAYFAEAATELRGDSTASKLPHAAVQHKAETDYEVIKSTVTLRYGSDEPLSRRRVHEAQVVVSQYTAATRAAAAAHNQQKQLRQQQQQQQPRPSGARSKSNGKSRRNSIVALAGALEHFGNAMASAQATARIHGTRASPGEDPEGPLQGIGAHYLSKVQAVKLGQQTVTEAALGSRPCTSHAGGAAGPMAGGEGNPSEVAAPEGASAVEALRRRLKLVAGIEEEGDKAAGGSARHLADPSNDSLLQVLSGSTPFQSRLLAGRSQSSDLVSPTPPPPRVGGMEGMHMHKARSQPTLQQLGFHHVTALGVLQGEDSSDESASPPGSSDALSAAIPALARAMEASRGLLVGRAASARSLTCHSPTGLAGSEPRPPPSRPGTEASRQRGRAAAMAVLSGPKASNKAPAPRQPASGQPTRPRPPPVAVGGEEDVQGVCSDETLGHSSPLLKERSSGSPPASSFDSSPGGLYCSAPLHSVHSVPLPQQPALLSPRNSAGSPLGGGGAAAAASLSTSPSSLRSHGLGRSMLASRMASRDVMGAGAARGASPGPMRPRTYSGTDFNGPLSPFQLTPIGPLSDPSEHVMTEGAPPRTGSPAPLPPGGAHLMADRQRSQHLDKTFARPPHLSVGGASGACSPLPGSPTAASALQSLPLAGLLLPHSISLCASPRSQSLSGGPVPGLAPSSRGGGTPRSGATSPTKRMSVMAAAPAGRSAGLPSLGNIQRRVMRDSTLDPQVLLEYQVQVLQGKTKCMGLGISGALTVGGEQEEEEASAILRGLNERD